MQGGLSVHPLSAWIGCYTSTSKPRRQNHPTTYLVIRLPGGTKGKLSRRTALHGGPQNTRRAACQTGGMRRYLMQREGMGWGLWFALAPKSCVQQGIVLYGCVLYDVLYRTSRLPQLLDSQSIRSRS